MHKRSLALIGFGRWGKNLARNFSNLGVLHTICDLQPPEEFSDDQVFLTSDIDSIIQNETITKVAIATSADTHFFLAKKALESGKDVFVEKPLCLTVSESEELVQLAEERHAVLMVGHLLHYHPCVQKIKSIVESGAIGEVKYISSHRTFPGALRPENALWDLAPHDISVILSLTNSFPRSVDCQGVKVVSDRAYDTVMMTLGFDSGCAAHVHASWVYPTKEQKMTIIGTQGTLVFDDVKSWEEKLTLSIREESQVVSYESAFVKVDKDEPLLMECQHFIDSCDKRSSPLTNGYEALDVVKILSAAQEILSDQQLILN